MQKSVATKVAYSLVRGLYSEAPELGSAIWIVVLKLTGGGGRRTAGRISVKLSLPTHLYQYPGVFIYFQIIYVQFYNTYLMKRRTEPGELVPLGRDI